MLTSILLFFIRTFVQIRNSYYVIKKAGVFQPRSRIFDLKIPQQNYAGEPIKYTNILENTIFFLLQKQQSKISLRGQPARKFNEEAIRQIVAPQSFAQMLTPIAPLSYDPEH